PDPGFPIYASMISFAGATGVPLALREENDYVPDLGELRRLVTPRTKLLILNSPHNPTGGVLSPEAIHEIAKIAREHDLWVLSDEIYAEIIYEGKHHSIMAEEGMAERTILLDGFSKTFAMTGWRLGYGAFPKLLVDPVAKLVTNSVSCTATFTQRAGVVAISQRPAEVDVMLAEFRRRRDAIVAGLNRIEGVTCRQAVRPRSLRRSDRRCRSRAAVARGHPVADHAPSRGPGDLAAPARRRPCPSDAALQHGHRRRGSAGAARRSVGRRRCVPGCSGRPSAPRHRPAAGAGRCSARR